MAGANQACIFCQIVRNPTSSTTHLLHTDDKVVAFQDIKPAAQRHYLVIPKDHIPTARDLQRRDEDYSLVSHMLSVGQELLQKDAPQTIQRFGFHLPPFNSVDHLHLHCFALPFMPRWKTIKYKSLGPFGGFIEVHTLLEKLRPHRSLHAKGSYWLRCMRLPSSSDSSLTGTDVILMFLQQHSYPHIRTTNYKLFWMDLLKAKKLKLAPVSCEENSSGEEDSNEPFLLGVTAKVFDFYFPENYKNCN